MKSMRKISAMFLASAMALSAIAGCTPAEETQSPEVSTETTVPTEPGSTLKDGVEVTLDFPSIWVATDTLASSFAELVTAFNEEYAGEIKIQVEEQTDYVAYRDKIRTLVTTGNAPDIFLIESPDDATSFAQSGNLLEMTPYVDDAWKDSFNAGVIDSALVDGKLYSVPFEVAYWPVIYNTELLSAAGYDEFPKTYDELWECCEALVANGVTPFTLMTGENAYTTMLWNSQAAIAVGGQEGATTLEGDAPIEAAEIIEKMFTYTTSDAIGSTAVVSRGHFMNERTAIYMNGPWIFGRFAEEGAEGFEDKIALATAPTVDGGAGEEGFVMSNTQQRIAFGAQEDPAKAEAAAEFLKYITQKEWIEKFTVESGRFFTVSTGEIEGLGEFQTELLGLIDAAPYSAPNMQMLPIAVQNELPASYDMLAFGDYTPEQFVEALSAIE